MKCYNHHSIEAVGVCKNCSKGICPDCLTDVGNGIACTASCAEELKAWKKQVKMNVGMNLFSAFSMVVAGLLFAYRGYASGSTSLILIGIWLVVIGVFIFIRPKKGSGNT